MRTLLLLMLATACGHSEPFSPPDHDLDGPLFGGEPARFTYGSAVGEPAWLPDGSAFIYAGGRLVGDTLDRCLSIVPAAGGTVRREICNPSLFDETIADHFGDPAVSLDERLSFFYANAPVNGPSGHSGIYTTSLATPAVNTAIRSVPFSGPDGVFYVAISHVRWLGADEIVFIGHAEELVVPCGGCDAFVIRHPRTLFRGSASAGAAFAPVPGTAFATSVAAGATPDEIYFTLAGDSRIYRTILSSGEQSMVHDFGAEGFARDVHFAGGRLAAIVGGAVGVSMQAVGPLQTFDRGGPLYVLEPATGAVRRLTDDQRWFRHPALSPAGTGLVGEGYAVSIRRRQAEGAPPIVDTMVSTIGDLWLYGAP